MTMENDLVDWGDLGSISCPTSVSPDTSLESNPSPNSSIAGSAGCEDTLQALVPYETTNPTVADLQDGLTVHHGCTEEPKHRCMHHTHPESERPIFTSKKELNRHMKAHDPKAILWYCGCCHNVGDKFEGKVRKDKVQTHLRNIHEKPKSEDNKGIRCPEEGCYTLFTAGSCLDEHLKQKHPSHPREVPNQTTNGSTCDCKQRAESKRLQEGLPSGTNKHRAGSPLESTAKRGRHDPVEYQSSELVPQSTRFPASTTNSLASMASTDNPWLPIDDAYLNPMNEARDWRYSNMASQLDVADWSRAITGRDPFFIEPGNMNQGIDILNLAPVYPFELYPQIPLTRLYQLFLEDSKPADFFAIRKTQDFQKLAITLRPDGYPCAPASAITYNPVKERITLIGSELKVKKAVAELRLLVENFSKRWGGKYLVTSQPSTSRALMLDSSSARSSTNSETARVFPIKPKEHRRLVQIWFKSILPALPQILRERLGGNYAASLVRRGQFDLRAEPCIQIESPCLPAPAAQRIIKDSVSEIFKKDGHEPISMHFTEGSVKKLNGGEGEDDDDGGESADFQRRELNYGRPYSKPGMGASVGLLCSKKCSATLGGYVLIDGEKYILTSEHFVSKSRELANRDGNESDCDTLTSPSRYDLNMIENNLKQTKRDLDGEINSLTQRTYGDRDIPEDALSDPNKLTPELRDANSRNDDVMSLLDQVTKPPLEYAVGSVKKSSLERRTEIISRSLANELGLQNDQLMVKHQMDWALFETNSQTTQNGENRHKYRSDQDAMDDDYVDERNHANQPGDVCYETCGAESGYTVYYVGQRSRHRSGKVHVPNLVCIESSETIVWAISDSDGRDIPCSDVDGDSGAWVIRKDGNKLMGQVHSHSQGRVLFTPIDVIFADLKEACGSDISLPPYPLDPGQLPSAISATPLCSVPRTPPVRPYRFLNPHPVASTTPPEISPVRTAPSKTRPLESSIKITSPSETRTAHGQRSSNPLCDSPSSLPSLTDSPQSSVTTPEYPKSPRSSGGADITNGQVDTEKLPSKSLPAIVGESTMSEIPDLSLDEQGEDQPVYLAPYAFQLKNQSLFRIPSSTRTPTWPVGPRSRVTKVQRGSGSFHLRTSRDHAVAFSARSVLDRFAQFARRIEDVTDTETTSSPSEHEVGPLPMLEDVSKRGYSPILEGCNVVA